MLTVLIKLFLIFNALTLFINGLLIYVLLKITVSGNEVEKSN